MNCVSIAFLKKVDYAVKRNLEGSKILQDFFIDEKEEPLLYAVTETAVEFKDLQPLQLEFMGDDVSEFLLFKSKKKTDFSKHLYRIFSDPDLIPSIIKKKSLMDGFTFNVGVNMHIPKDLFKAYEIIDSGTPLTEVYLASGEPVAKANKNLLIIRVCGRFMEIDEVKNALKQKTQNDSKKNIELNIESFSIEKGKLAIDNTFKEKTIKIHSF